MTITAWLIIGLIALVGVLGLVVAGQSRRLAATRRENARLMEDWNAMNERADRLLAATQQTAALTEEANGERKEVNETPDAGLVDRANSLFGGGSAGGMRDNESSVPSGS
jgi:hypothetical protein